MPDFDGHSVPFQQSEATQALLAAMGDLADRVGCSLSSLEGWTLGEAYDKAVEVYPTLPEFWRVWRDWYLPDGSSTMGDL